MNATANAPDQASELRLLYMRTEFASAIILTVLSPVSVLANVLLMVAVRRDPLRCLRGRPVTYFILNLSIADLICGAVVEPFFALNYYARALSPSLRPISAKLYMAGGMISMATISCSFLLVLQLSLAQFLAIRCPVRYRTLITKKRVLCCVVTTWAYFAGFSLVWAFSGVSPIIFMKIHLTLHASLISVLLAVVQVLSYRAFKRTVAGRLTSRSETKPAFALELTSLGSNPERVHLNVARKKKPEKSRHKTTERQFTVMTFCLAAMVLFSALPHVIVLYVFLYTKQRDFTEEVIVNIALRISDILLFVKVAADPFLFAWRLPDYRDALLVALGFKQKTTDHGESTDLI